ncbi:hypothetical protein PR048_019507, partial [Dryococelus australis]
MAPIVALRSTLHPTTCRIVKRLAALRTVAWLKIWNREIHVDGNFFDVPVKCRYIHSTTFLSRGATSARLLPRRSAFNPRPGHSGFSHVEIVPDDAVGRRVFLGNLPFPSLLHSGSAPYPLQSLSSALKTSMLRGRWNGGVNGGSPLKHTDQPHRPARFLHAKIRERPLRESNPKTTRNKSFAITCTGRHASAFLDACLFLASGSFCSPPTKANRVQSPAGSPDFRKWESCRMMPLVGGFSRDLPFHPPLHSGAAPYSLQSPSSALKTSLLRAAQISSLTQDRSATSPTVRCPATGYGFAGKAQGRWREVLLVYLMKQDAARPGRVRGARLPSSLDRISQVAVEDAEECTRAEECIVEGTRGGVPVRSTSGSRFRGGIAFLLRLLLGRSEYPPVCQQYVEELYRRADTSIGARTSDITVLSELPHNWVPLLHDCKTVPPTRVFGVKAMRHCDARGSVALSADVIRYRRRAGGRDDDGIPRDDHAAGPGLVLSGWLERDGRGDTCCPSSPAGAPSVPLGIFARGVLTVPHRAALHAATPGFSCIMPPWPEWKCHQTSVPEHGLKTSYTSVSLLRVPNNHSPV